MKILLLALALCASLSGCKTADKPATYEFPNATCKWGNGHVWTDSIYREVGQYALFETQYQDVLGSAPFSVDRLRQENPNIRISMYIHGHSVAEWEIKHLRDADPSPYQDWARMGLANLAWTTEGDTFRTFNRNYMLTTSDSSTVRQMVAVLEKWTKSCDNGASDGLSWMIDYMTSPATSWVYGEQARQMHGELDLNQNGIPHAQDIDEQKALRDGYCYLADLLRERIPHVKVRANGVLPYRDHDLMQRLDGALIEGAFRWGFGDRYIENALVGQPPYLFSEIVKWYRPGGYSVLEGQFYSQQAMAMALMLDAPEHRVFAIIKPQDGTRTLAQDNLRSWYLGAPLGLAVTDGRTMTRTFQGGRMDLEIMSGVYPSPFTFEAHNLLGETVIRF